LGRGPAAGSPLGDGGPAVAPGPVKVVGFFFGVAAGDPPTHPLGLVKAINSLVPPTLPTHAGAIGASGGDGLVVVEVGGTARLLGGDAPEAHTLVGKEHSRTSQQELAELEDRIQAPALEEQDAAAEQADGGKKDVVIPG
jgi:hypothetical protein